MYGLFQVFKKSIHNVAYIHQYKHYSTYHEASLFLVGPSWLWSYRELWSISLLGGAVVVMIVSWIMEHLSSWWGRRGYDCIVNYGASLFLVGPSWLWLYRELWSISLLGGAVVVMIVWWLDLQLPIYEISTYHH
jgi:hypothetical protein